MITHNGVAISLYEQTGFDEGDFKVTRTDGIVFKAASVYGKSYARTPEVAIEGAKKQIDAAGKRTSRR